ncbi:MAG: tRNA-dependent cyclodipeptide synthase [Pseudomonadota bacterium]
MGRRKNEFPAQTGPYAVKVKNGAHWRGFKTARLQISVGQPYHEGDKLGATLDWCKHRFDHVIVCVNDTLQRLNGQFDGLSPDEAFAASKLAGDEWMNRYAGSIGMLPSAEIHSWEDWRARPDYAKAFAQTQSLYANNAEFRGAIDANIKDFWARRKIRDGLTGDFGFTDFAACSRAYLIEETAVFSMMFKDKRAVDVYPGSVLLPSVVFQGRHVPGAPEGLDQGAFTRIDFNKKRDRELKVA